jgi:hypothetical protein
VNLSPDENARGHIRMKKPSLLDRIPQIIIILLIFTFSGLLSIYCLKGFYSRYAQDDYCYGYRVRAQGFWNMQLQSYFHPTEFNSDRYSSTAVQSLVELSGGPSTVPVLTSLELIVWFASLSFVFYQLQLLLNSKANSLTAILPALAIIFFTLYLAGDQYQILFWLSAMQAYFTPVVLAALLFGCLLFMARIPQFSLPYAIGLGLLSFFAAGFSETAGLWQFACWCLILGWSFVLSKRLVFARNTIRPALVLVGSAALSLIVMAICPANPKSGQIMYHLDFLGFSRQSLYFGAGFLWSRLKATPLPYFVLILLGFLIKRNQTIINPDKDGLKVKKFIVEILAVILTLYGLSVVVMLPSLYSKLTYPGERALFPAQFTLSVCLFIIGWKIAELLASFKPNVFSYRFSIVFQGLLGLALCAYIAHVGPRVYDKLPAFQGRAQAWDLRQALILNEKAAGTVNVIAPEFDSVYGVTELHPEATNWVNKCAAKYYGVQTISTIENYAGISAHPIGK